MIDCKIMRQIHAATYMYTSCQFFAFLPVFFWNHWNLGKIFSHLYNIMSEKQADVPATQLLMDGI